MTRVTKSLMLAAVVGAWSATVASAAPQQFNFGALIGTGTYTCNGTVGVVGTDCILGGNTSTYSFGGTTVTADAFAGNTPASVPASTLSQRFNLISTGEAGLGVASNGQNQNSGDALEIGDHLSGVAGALDEYLVLDLRTAITAGYTNVSIEIGSIQGVRAARSTSTPAQVCRAGRSQTPPPARLSGTSIRVLGVLTRPSVSLVLPRRPVSWSPRPTPQTQRVMSWWRISS